MKIPDDLHYTPECYRATLHFLVRDMMYGGTQWQMLVNMYRGYFQQCLVWATLSVDMISALSNAAGQDADRWSALIEEFGQMLKKEVTPDA